MLSFALVNWGSFSAWIGTYFLGCIKKNHDSSQVITFSKSLGLFNVLKNVSTNVRSISFCSRVRSLSTIFEHTFFMLKLLCKICWTVSLSMLINSAIAQMLRRRFRRTISLTFSMLVSGVFEVLGQLGRWSSPISSLPSLSLLNNLKTWVRDQHSSPPNFNKSYVSVADFPSFTQNFTLTCCSMLTLNMITTEKKKTIHFKQRLLPNCLPHDLEIVTVDGGESTSQYHTRLAAAKFTGKQKKIKSGYFTVTPRTLSLKGCPTSKHHSSWSTGLRLKWNCLSLQIMECPY